jgi:hypothetical protein
MAWQRDTARHNFIYLGLGLISAATLAFELALTRLFAVAQWYHFAFLAVSVALLGFGASGTALALRPGLARRPLPPTLAWVAVAFSAGLLLGYLGVNYIPFDPYRIAWERSQFLYLVPYYLAPALPFFCSGLALALALAARPAQAAAIYATSMVGSAVGAAGALLLLAAFGGPGTVLFCAAVGWLAAGVFCWGRYREAKVLQKVLAVPYLFLLGALVFAALRLPPPFELRLSPYKGLSQVLHFPDAELVFRGWDATARVDVVRSGAIRSAPGLSLNYMGQMPRQLGLFTDGDDLSPITLDGAGTRFADYLLAALPYHLRPGARALLLEPRGGLDVLVALEGGASAVTAVESIPPAVAAARASCARQGVSGVYDAPRVTTVLEHGRSYAHRSAARFDIVQLALIGSYRPVVTGTYSLAEDYLYTTEAVEDYLGALEEGGLLAMERWLQLPPSESLRAGGLVVAALERRGVAQPGRRLVVVRSMQTALLLVKNGDFSGEEIAQVKEFCRARSFDLVYYPGMGPAEANIYNILPGPYYYDAFQEILDADRRWQLYANYPFDITPPSDDRPFFPNFFRWRQTPTVLATMGRTWQPFGGSGYLVLVALLALSALASGGLILLPLAVGRRGEEERGKELAVSRGRVFLFFALLGLAYLFVEIPLLQRFILFLGQPVIAFAVVLAVLLLGSGGGSFLAPRLPLAPSLGVLVAGILAYPLLLPGLFALFLGWPLAGRLVVAALSVLPLGFLMGIPFPKGVAHLEKTAPRLIPWAWGINGCASVMAAILAAMGALTFGLSGVLLAGALAYGGALAASLGWRR